jgi:hypothetical protein
MSINIPLEILKYIRNKLNLVLGSSNTTRHKIVSDTLKLVHKFIEDDSFLEPLEILLTRVLSRERKVELKYIRSYNKTLGSLIDLLESKMYDKTLVERFVRKYRDDVHNITKSYEKKIDFIDKNDDIEIIDSMDGDIEKHLPMNVVASFYTLN